MVTHGKPCARIIGSSENYHVQHANYLDLTRAHCSDPATDALLLPTRTSPLLLSPARTALVVVDMQNFFLSQALGRRPGPGTAAASQLANVAIPAARKAGIRVVWLNWGLTEDDIAKLPPSIKRAFGDDGVETDIEAKVAPGVETVDGTGKNKKLYKGLGSEMGTVVLDGKEVDAGRVLMRDQWNAALYPPLDGLWEEGKTLEQRPDVWLHKDRMSGMWGARTDCQDFLEKEGITSLIFTGVNTDQCVSGTLTDAFSKGYDCILLADGCGTTSPQCAQEGIEHNAARTWGWLSDCQSLAAAVKNRFYMS
ncbi:hypothetical protein CAC42_8257 [Sphaceloma murrayae]|uniref:Isochorismatase-like domain-containing protein n=1 Tax=Sphaceloma murrayae TaxID=2082308 RepID=A0A2K1QJD5_9PEZI|nr:hypothetical protein CAC42_8257 [Sphaceloma murrayae]